MNRELVVITGMSGAGRSTVAHAMEDHGWYVIDNLPPLLLLSVFDMTELLLLMFVDGSSSTISTVHWLS
jgi:RNase adaptor protein for sRNA GlmZ degradation